MTVKKARMPDGLTLGKSLAASVQRYLMTLLDVPVVVVVVPPLLEGALVEPPAEVNASRVSALDVGGAAVANGEAAAAAAIGEDDADEDDEELEEEEEEDWTE